MKKVYPDGNTVICEVMRTKSNKYVDYCIGTDSCICILISPVFNNISLPLHCLSLPSQVTHNLSHNLLEHCHIYQETFAWLSRYKRILNSMPKAAFEFTLHRLVMNRNLYTEHCYRYLNLEYLNLLKKNLYAAMNILNHKTFAMSIRKTESLLTYL